MSFVPSTPATGIIDGAIGLSTDGTLSGVGLSAMAVAGVDTTKMPDDGGIVVTATGVFTANPTTVMLVDPVSGLSRVCYSGVIGQGSGCITEDGDTLQFVVPAFPIGGPYNLTFDNGLSTATLTGVMTVVHRSFTTRHYSLRRSADDRVRNVGSRDIQNESKQGQTQGLWEGIYSAIADTIYDMAGYLLVRTTAPATGAATTLAVEATHRWPDAGRFAVAGATFFYASKTDTTFDGITQEDGTPGIGDTSIRESDVVMDLSRVNTQTDDLRATFFIGTADGNDLDVIGRNYGIPRPRGLENEQYRQLLQVMIAIEAQTMYACEQILDILFGIGNYELYEHLEQDKHRVFVKIDTTLDALSETGKTYLSGGEEQPRTSPTTVDVSMPATLAYGVWDVTDPYRAGTNFAFLPIAGSTSAGMPTHYTSIGAFIVSDSGKPIILDGVEHWRILNVLGPDEVELGMLPHDDATIDPAEPDEFETAFSWFEAWMVGHEVQINTGVEAGNAYEIAEVLTPRRVRLVGAAFGTAETDVEWQMRPKFTTVGAVAGSIHRASVAGVTVTTPIPMPVTVLVDYTTVSSAQALTGPLEDGNDQFPFYLWDDSFIAQTFLDLITAAGVEVVLES